MPHVNLALVRSVRTQCAMVCALANLFWLHRSTKLIPVHYYRAFDVALDMSSFSVKKLVKGFGYAGSGLKAALRSEQNFRVHAVAAILVVLMAVIFNVHAYEWLILIICMGMVMGMELLNTAVEKICDQIMPEKHPGIRYIKDVSAAAVLVVAIGAAAAGLIIFIPRLLQWI